MEIIGIKQNKGDYMKKITQVIRISFLTNMFLSIVKIIVGLIGKSGALIADGIHSFSDLVTDVVAIFGNHMSGKPADKEHPYGHGRLEYLTSVGIGIVVILVGLSLINSVVTSEITIPSKLVIIVSFGTIITKFLLSRFLIKKGELYDNNILIASGKESSADVYSSVIVLISSILIQFEEYFHPLIYSDKVAGVIVGIFIVKTGFLILKENVSILIGEQETNSNYTKKITKIINKEKMIKSIDSLVILKYGHYYKISIEISMDGNLSLKEAHDIADSLEQTLINSDERNKYITIHINPYIET